MTFACKVKTLKEDIDLYIKYCSNIYPHDFELFIELTQDIKKD
jgi:hypothetical protein